MCGEGGFTSTENHWPMVKHSGCSCRGPEFNSQHPHVIQNHMRLQFQRNWCHLLPFKIPTCPCAYMQYTGSKTEKRKTKLEWRPRVTVIKASRGLPGLGLTTPDTQLTQSTCSPVKAFDTVTSTIIHRVHTQTVQMSSNKQTNKQLNVSSELQLCVGLHS